MNHVALMQNTLACHASVSITSKGKAGAKMLLFFSSESSGQIEEPGAVSEMGTLFTEPRECRGNACPNGIMLP